jgi:hypothetical protein
MSPARSGAGVSRRLLILLILRQRLHEGQRPALGLVRDLAQKASIFLDRRSLLVGQLRLFPEDTGRNLGANGSALRLTRMTPATEVHTSTLIWAVSKETAPIALGFPPRVGHLAKIVLVTCHDVADGVQRAE